MINPDTPEEAAIRAAAGERAVQSYRLKREADAAEAALAAACMAEFKGLRSHLYEQWDLGGREAFAQVPGQATVAVSAHVMDLLRASDRAFRVFLNARNE